MTQLVGPCLKSNQSHCGLFLLAHCCSSLSNILSFTLKIQLASGHLFTTLTKTYLHVISVSREKTLYLRMFVFDHINVTLTTLPSELFN